MPPYVVGTSVRLWSWLYLSIYYCLIKSGDQCRTQVLLDLWSSALTLAHFSINKLIKIFFCALTSTNIIYLILKLCLGVHTKPHGSVPSHLFAIALSLI